MHDEFIASHGPLPTLLERDSDIPALSDLVAQAQRADAVMVSRQRDVVASNPGRPT